MADVSVIVPAYNSALTIGACLRSIAAQTVPPKEVIVVDDGSTDGSFEAALALAGEMKGIALKVFRQDNAGAGAARNRALLEATGTYVAFLDADDQWLPEKLEKCLPFVADYDLVCHNFIQQEGEKNPLGNSARHLKDGDDPFPALFLRGFVATSTVITRRDLVLNEGGFDPSLRAGQDYDLWIALAARLGARFKVLDEPLSLYHINPQGITSAVERRMQAGLRIMRRQTFNLKGRVRFPHLFTLKRLTVIHVEAFNAWKKQGRWGQAAFVLLRWVGTLATELFMRRHSSDPRPTRLETP